MRVRPDRDIALTDAGVDEVRAVSEPKFQLGREPIPKTMFEMIVDVVSDLSRTEAVVIVAAGCPKCGCQVVIKRPEAGLILTKDRGITEKEVSLLEAVIVEKWNVSLRRCDALDTEDVDVRVDGDLNQSAEMTPKAIGDRRRKDGLPATR